MDPSVFIYGGTFESQDQIHVIESFLIDKVEITVAAYQKCVKAGKCSAPRSQDNLCNYGVSSKEDHPMNCVSWHEAVDYCAWTNKRLPTEWEWEWVARGRNDARPYPWGSNNNNPKVCWERNSCDINDITIDVSRDGVIGMGSNSWEWTSSEFNNIIVEDGETYLEYDDIEEEEDDYYIEKEGLSTTSFEIQLNPPPQELPSSETRRVVRGGGFWGIYSKLMPTNRKHVNQTENSWLIGFRCAKSIP